MTELTYQERAEVFEKAARHAKRAIAYLKNASVWLPFLAEHKMQAPVDYWQLLDSALATAADIVEALPDDFFESEQATDWLGLGLDVNELKYNSSDPPLEAAMKVVAAIKERRARGEALDTIRRLENVTGRTPEEAASYLAKAAELKARLEGRPADAT